MGEAPETGDTALTEGVNLFQPTDPPFVEAGGDSVVQNEVHLLDQPVSGLPKAGDLRQLGYPVSGELADDEPVAGYMSDTPVPEGKVNLYEERPETPGGPAPEEPVVRLVEPEPPSAVSDPTSEQHGARTPEEQARADEEAEIRAEEADSHFQNGVQAANMGEPRSANPYDGRRLEGKAWLRGWDSVSAQEPSEASAQADTAEPAQEPAEAAPEPEEEAPA